MTALIGVIDGFNGRGVFGWARRHDDEASLRLDIKLDGLLVAENVPADRLRKDLVSAGDTHGRHGFVWELPASATFGDRVKVAVLASGSGEVIAEREFGAPFSGTPWRGAIREPKKGALSGWVKLNGRNDPVVADVYLDEHRVASGFMCDRAVPELATEDGAGAWGFNVPIGRFRTSSESVVVSLRDPADGSIMLEREVSTAALKDSYRGSLEVTDAADVRGWAINENWPDDVFDVEVLLDGHPYLTVKNSLPRNDLRKAGLANGQGGVRFANPLHRWVSDGAEHALSLRFPDQTTSDDYRFSSHPRQSQGGSVRFEEPSHRGVTIIVPIYNAPDDLSVCIERLLAHTPGSASILLIDDCSPDARVKEVLARHRDNTRIRILANETNMGFTRTVNRGIVEAGDDDVVLLNSDARVTPGWLDGMLAAAANSPRTATVTAMSDRAGAFSAPRIGNENPLPAGVDEIAYARAFRRESVRVYPRVPTGNGFCMWISRLCIEEIGPLDAQAFPRGYGEENDFCMRAGRAGWIHVIDDSTYVFHDRSKSFGDSKTELLAAGRAVVDARYPEYKHAIRVFRESPEIAIARNRAHVALTVASTSTVALPRVLYAISTTTGGTPQTNADLMNALDDAVEPWVLRCDSREMTLSRVVDGELHPVHTHELDHELEPIGHISPEYDSVIGTWLRQCDFDIVHIRHLLWHSLSLPGIATQLGMKVVVSFHDYYALSPNLKLIDDRGTYLGDEYVGSGSVYRDSGWPVQDYPTPTGDWLQWWQDRFWRAIRMCDAFVTTSESARDLILYHFPEMDPERFSVIEHGRDFDVLRFVAARPIYGEPLRILVPGGINAAKGAEILRSMADADAHGQIEWHILGPIKEKFESKGSRVVYHGAYKRENFGKLVEKIAPHAGAVLSIWDETYCHTLTEMWSVGIPVFVLDFPNVAQRVRRFNAGWVLEGMDGPSLLSQMTEALYDREARVKALRGVSDWQHGWGIAWTTKQMAVRYLDIYRRVLAGSEADSSDTLRVGVLSRSSRDLTRAPASTYARLWERTRNSVARDVDFLRVTPDGAIASVRQGLVDGLIVQRDAVPAAAVTDLITALDAAGAALVIEEVGELMPADSESSARLRDDADAPAPMGLLRGATAFSVSTEAGRDRLADMDAPVEVFPAALSDRLWSVPVSPRVRDGKVRALYFGDRTHRANLDLVLPALDAFAATRPDFELMLIGIAHEDEVESLRDGRPWLQSVEVPESARQFPESVEWLHECAERSDFAIAPLTGTELNTSLADLRLLEHLAMGLRTIGSAVGPYRETSIPGITVVANSHEAWVDALRRMSAEVEAEGSRIDGRVWLVENGMLSEQQPRFDQFLRSAVITARVPQ
ncbi:hypothetical protein RU09_06495 [Microbacterium sp. MEJ108Y]|nr:hypothetical protein RU09_06495 [Microbacterium sp. MEJ108Y]